MFGADVKHLSILDDEPGYDINPAGSLDYLFPKFSYQSPWVHTATAANHTSGCLREDFIMIAEFSEQEGPRPVIVIPKDGGNNFDQNEFSVKILSVDHQSSIVEGCEITEDAQVVMSDPDKNAHAFIHHIVLNDIQARGYVRPFCISYVTSDPMKVMKCFEEISTEMKKVARLMKYGNRLVFMRDLEKYLEDLSYTKAHLLISQSRWQMSAQGDNDLFNALNTIRQSMEEVRDILDKLKPLLMDAELEERFHNFERQVKYSRPQTCDEGDCNSLKNFDTKDLHLEEGKPGSYTDRCSTEYSLFSKSKDLKPKVLDVSTLRGKRRFDRSLRGLHELCSWGAKEGLQRLRTIREIIRRDLSSIHQDELDKAVFSPDCGVLSFGFNSIGANFLTSCKSSKDVCCLKRRLSYIDGNQGQGHLSSLGSVESFKSLSSSFQSFLDEDTMYSANSSMIETESNSFTLDRLNSILDENGARDISEQELLDDSNFFFGHEESVSVDTSMEFETTVGNMNTFEETLKQSEKCEKNKEHNIHRDTTKERSNSNISEYDTIDVEKDLKCFAKGCKCGKNTFPVIDGKTNGIPQTVDCRCIDTQNENGASGCSRSKELRKILNIGSGVRHEETSKLLDCVMFSDKDRCNNDQRLDPSDNINQIEMNRKSADTEDTEDGGELKNFNGDLLKAKSNMVGIKASFDNILRTVDETGAEPRSETNMIHMSIVCGDSNGNLNNLSDILDHNKENPTFSLSESLFISTHNTGSGKKLNAQDCSINASQPKPTASLVGHMFVDTKNKKCACTCNETVQGFRNKCSSIKIDRIGETCDICENVENHSESSSTDTENSSVGRDHQRIFVDPQKQLPRVATNEELTQRYSRRKWRITHPFSNMFDAYSQNGDCLLKVLCGFNNLQHVAYSLLSGRPVVVIGTRNQENLVRDFIHALAIFTPVVPGLDSVSLICQIKQLKVTDVHKFQLRGMIKTDRQTVDYLIPSSIRRYLTLVDVEKLLIYCQPYQGSLLNILSAVYNRKKSFKSELSLFCYLEMCLLDFSTKAFNFYHCISSGETEYDFSGVAIPRKSDMLKQSAEKYLNKSGFLNSDCRIIKHLSEIVKIQQIEEEFCCKYLTDSPVYPFGIAYQSIQTYRL